MRIKKINILCIIIAVCILVIIFLPGYSKLQQLSAKNKSLEQEIDRLTERIEHLTLEKELLENDIGYVEKIARKKLGLAKEKELIYKFSE